MLVPLNSSRPYHYGNAYVFDYGHDYAYAYAHDDVYAYDFRLCLCFHQHLRLHLSFTVHPKRFDHSRSRSPLNLDWGSLIKVMLLESMSLKEVLDQKVRAHTIHLYRSSEIYQCLENYIMMNILAYRILDRASCAHPGCAQQAIYKTSCVENG